MTHRINSSAPWRALLGTPLAPVRTLQRLAHSPNPVTNDCEEEFWNGQES